MKEETLADAVCEQALFFLAPMLSFAAGDDAWAVIRLARRGRQVGAASTWSSPPCPSVLFVLAITSPRRVRIVLAGGPRTTSTRC